MNHPCEYADFIPDSKPVDYLSLIARLDFQAARQRRPAEVATARFPDFKLGKRLKHWENAARNENARRTAARADETKRKNEKKRRRRNDGDQAKKREKRRAKFT